MRTPLSLRALLLPLVPLYRLALAARELRLRWGFEPVRRLRYPVIAIGNLSTGGSGKTPLTIALAKALAQRGFQVDVLSRGYGRQSRLPARVHPDGTAEEFGDEPLLIARETGLPVYVAKQRYDAGLLAESKGTGFSPHTNPANDAGLLVESKGTGFSPYINPANVEGALAPEGNGRTVHLLDDGFQHRQLARDIDIALLNRHDWHDHLLPAGNLREPLKSIRRATVLAIPADDPRFESELRAWGWQGPIWRIKRTMDVPAIAGPVVAFCGIARPHQFFHGLESAGLTLAARKAFPDHHRYTAADLDELKTSALAAKASALLTTEKDFVRLAKLTAALPSSLPLIAARLHIEIENESTAIDWLVSSIGPAHPRPPL